MNEKLNKTIYICYLYVLFLACLFRVVTRIIREKKFRNGTGSEQRMSWFMRICLSKIYLALVVIKRWRHLSEILLIQWHCWTGQMLSMDKPQS